MNKQEFRNIPVDQLHESATNPRQRFDRTELDDLTASVRAQGIVQPIVVRPLADGEGFEIVAGARRVRASQGAGLASVPALVRELTDTQVIEIQIIENLQRAGVHPLDEARGFQVLLQQSQGEVATVAAKVGKSESYIYQRLKLRDLIAPAQKAFLAGKLTVGHALHVARLQPAVQKEALEYCLDEWEPATVKDLAAWIENTVHLDLKAARFALDDAALLPAAGSCVACPKRSGYQPALFPDVKHQDTCTDPACFKAKLDAVIEATKAEAVTRGAPLIELSGQWQASGQKLPGVVYRSGWEEASAKRCADTASGIVVDGHERGRLLPVCTNKACSVHRPGRTDSSGVDRAAAKAEVAKGRALKQAERQATEAILAKVGKLAGDDLRLVVEAFAAEMWHESIKTLCQRRGWEPGKTSYGGRDYRGAISKAMAKMSDADLTKLLLELALNSRAGGAAGLEQAAKRHSVDLPALRKAALAEAKAKSKAVKKAPPSKKKQKS